MILPDMTQPTQHPERAVRSTINYRDGTSRLVFTTDVEMPFPEGRLIVSRVDLDGNITHANDAFVEISGWLRENLIGAPQYILRHPDMPKVTFKDLWETVAAGKKWHGYVKNLCKDGSFYWVYATAVPNIRQGKIAGYTSVRRKPSRARIEAVIPLYRQWLAQEKEQEAASS